MENELDLLLGTAVNSLAKLEILLYVHQRPGLVQGARDYGAGLRRPPGEVRLALEQLAAAGLLDRFALGTGRHVVYGAPEDEHVRLVLDLLYTRYHREPAERARVVHQIVGGVAEGEAAETGGPDAPRG